ncbi:MAG: hypothetical protein HY536_00060, partial [Candidatus Colwellbacteria bacterium]|nr:hypothetical protein [Candidatus Colwellbacteria bacterium]
KTARELLTSYRSLEEVYDDIALIKPAVAQKLETFRAQAFLSRELATIDRNVPLDITSIADLALSPLDREKLIVLCRTHGFASLLARLETH